MTDAWRWARIVAERDALARELFIARALLSMWHRFARPKLNKDEAWLHERVGRYLALSSALDDPPDDDLTLPGV
jgi:hypothetical protein